MTELEGSIGQRFGEEFGKRIEYPETRMSRQERRLFQIANLERRLEENWNGFITHHTLAGTLRALQELNRLYEATNKRDGQFEPNNILWLRAIEKARAERLLRIHVNTGVK